MTHGAVFAESARSSIALDGIRLMTYGAVVPTRRPQSRQSRQKPLRVSSALLLRFWVFRHVFNAGIIKYIIGKFIFQQIKV
jgi:hypothetical protein